MYGVLDTISPSSVLGDRNCSATMGPLLDVSGTIAGSQEFLDPSHVGMANAVGA